MADKDAQSRVQKAMISMVDSIDRSHIRRMDKAMHECAANCLSNEEASVEQVHGCIAKCQEKTVKAQKFVEAELTQFQTSLHRCVLSCQDEVRDQLTPSTQESEIQKFQKVFEDCSIACCDRAILKLPNISEKIKSELNNYRP